MAESNSIKRTLVTGATGLLGSCLVKELLQQGYSVRALYHHTAPNFPAHKNLEIFKADILDVFEVEEAFREVDIVYHCAGLVSYQARDRIRTYKINVEGTANIVNRALEAGIEKLIHVSSVAALSKLPDQPMITEKMNWINDKDTSTYGHSKFLGEMEVWRGIAEGLTAVIVNPSIILGAGNWEEGSTKIFKTIYDGFPWYSTGTMGFVGAKDVAKAMILLAESDIKEERFILNAENYSYKNLFENIAKSFNKKPPHKKVTPFIASVVIIAGKLKKIFTGKSPLVTSDNVATAMATTLYDNSKLLKVFPAFEYQKIEDVVSEVCAELKQNLNKQ